MRDDGAGIRLLHFRRQMALGDPRRAEAEAVGKIDLLEEIREHRSLVRHEAIDHRLRDREEDVELHGTLQ